MESKIITVSRYIYNSIIKLITPKKTTTPKVDIIHDYKIKLMEEGKFTKVNFDLSHHL